MVETHPVTEKPRVYVEEPERLPISITINKTPNPTKVLKDKKILVNFLYNPFTWRSRKLTFEWKPNKSVNICEWYKRRRALNELENERKKELRAEDAARRDEYENQRLHELTIWENLKKKRLEKERKRRVQRLYDSPIYNEPTPVIKTKKIKKENTHEAEKSLNIKERPLKPIKRVEEIKEENPTPKTKLKKNRKIIEEPPLPNIVIVEQPQYKIEKQKPCVRPTARSKYVTVNKFNTRRTITDRFVNCCYKVCCQLYCYLTCIVVIVFTVIFLI
ncbi:uncharacterized protein LOC126974381 [Leptidea sinapis]|uniref:uncharacterized protein LOC126974381 n=1 Tax=Leptidea sinapis TaxID=189913 RepID=UPI0021C281F1|nr:uncharacterized protein LOC126974381 [Leptidea sinapis]